MENLRTALIAFVIVFLGLSTLALAIQGLQAIVRFRARSEARRLATVAAAAASPVIEQGIPAEELAVVMAAVSSVLGRNVRIHRVHPHSGDRSAQAWSRAGRVDLMYSHRVEPPRK
jgi:hypothetical protein